jgi:hypothetical protein
MPASRINKEAPLEVSGHLVADDLIATRPLYSEEQQGKVKITLVVPDGTGKAVHITRYITPEEATDLAGRLIRLTS